jgi:hypothetical protein
MVDYYTLNKKVCFHLLLKLDPSGKYKDPVHLKKIGGLLHFSVVMKTFSQNV